MTYKILLIILAGFFSASFVTPTKYLRNLTKTTSWFYFSICLCFMPWLILAAIEPHSFFVYAKLPMKLLALQILGGLIYGIGLFCFAKVVQNVGIALSITVNLGIGVVLGSLFVIFYNNMVFTPQGYRVYFALLFTVAGLISYYYAKKTVNDDYNSGYLTNWLLIIFTGCTTGLQNSSFVILDAYRAIVFPEIIAYWVLVPFLSCGGFAMAMCFLFRPIDKPPHPHAINATVINTILVILMGLLFVGSLALYSIGMAYLTIPQKMIGWPTFVLAIILTSQTWGFIYKEHDLSSSKSKFFTAVSLGLFILAVIMLALAR